MPRINARLLAAGLAALLLSVALASAPALGATNLQLKGNISMALQYTPENLWEAYTHYNIYSDFTVGESIQAYVFLGNLDSEVPFYQPNQGTIPLLLDRAYLKVVAPLYEGGPRIAATVGSLTLDYSPYTVKVSYPQRGISLEGIPIGSSGTLNGFALWDGLPYKTAFGGKYEGSLGKLHLTGIYAIQQDNTVMDNGTSKAYGIPKSEAQVASLEITTKVSRTASLNGLYVKAWNKADGRDSTQGRVRRLSLTMRPTSGVTLELGVKDHDPVTGSGPVVFNPPYRDTSEDNVVDDQADQRGFFGTVSTTLLGAKVSAGYERYTNHDASPTLTEKTQLAGQKSVGPWQISGDSQITTVTQPSPYGPGNRSTEMESHFTVQRDVLWAQTKVTPYYSLHVLEQLNPAEVTHSLGVKTTLALGKVKGVELDAGLTLLPSRQMGHYVLTSYKTPGGLAVRANWTTPNKPDDVEGEEDNIFQLSLGLDL